LYPNARDDIRHQPGNAVDSRASSASTIAIVPTLRERDAPAEYAAPAR